MCRCLHIIVRQNKTPMNHRTIHKSRSKRVCSVLAFLTLVAPASAAVVTVYWTGTITQYSYFGGAVPAGLANGVSISGDLSFDTANYDSRVYLNGSHSFGERYGYGSSALLRFSVANSEWILVGTDITFDTKSYEPMQSFDATSHSDRNGFLAFPGYAGMFAGGFALFAENSPYPVFDSSDIETAAFDFENPTSGGGSLTTQLLDVHGDIVEGYYLSFTISQSSSSPIPEPSVPLFFVVGTCAVLARRSRQTTSRARRLF